MRVGSARALAAEWVMQHACQDSGFLGAYFSGSTVWLPDDAQLSPNSDIDVVIVLTQDETPIKLGKFVYRGTLLEVTYLSWSEISPLEELMRSYHLANSLRKDTIITDPTGRLHKLQKQVALYFADPKYVRLRCLNVREKIETGINSFPTSAPLHDQVTAWLFPTGITTHMILVAALRNPTVRLRYLAARQVLLEYGYEDFYSDLLTLLGCAHLTPERVKHHLDELGKTFDAACAAAKTPFFFSTDITPASRPIVIDGSQELIRTGYHLEAVFWMVATFARCHKILYTDAPLDVQRIFTPALEDIISDLGIYSTEDFIRRGRDVIDFLPKLYETAEAIILDNPSISASKTPID